jgi:AraC family transcriptional regulator, regulatory protein of adaptative response / DNA-3-methyladenine glycosylase II
VGVRRRDKPAVVSGFQGVVTTGIYCRPGCSARPLPANVRPFPLAAAAEAAGFRACLRCRPYRVATTVGEVGPELLCRAVRLILDGGLDGATEADLARRLGVSARHLRRLFVANVGVTPDQLARSQRAHFARRLLDDTDLTFTDIAFAAGFGSVRQLNRACQDVFRDTPSGLRARRRTADRLAADGGLTLRLPVDGALDWDVMVGYFASRAIPGVESVSDGVYRRTVVIEGDPGVLELLQGSDENVILRAHLPHWAGLIHVVQRARRVLNLDADLDAAHRHLGEDELLGPMLRAQPGLRAPGTWDPFETGVRAILGQQVSVAGATTLAGRLVERYGSPVPGLATMGLHHTFPTARALAATDLRGLGLPDARARAVSTFARAVDEGTVRLDRTMALDELVSSISALPGLGPWTANYVALRLGEPDAFPAGDLGLRRAIDPDAVRSERELAVRAERWRPWRALAAVHLWSRDAAGTLARR